MNLKEHYKALLNEALLNEASAAKSVRRYEGFQNANVAAQGQEFEGKRNSSAAAVAARKDYETAAAARGRSIRSRDWKHAGMGSDAVRGAAVALARTPKDRQRAEKLAKARWWSRGEAGGSPVLRAAALAGQPLGPNLRTLLSKAEEMHRAAKSKGQEG